MRRLSPHLAPAGYSPARYVPLSPAPELDQGHRLTDIAAIQRLFANGENGGYWPADPQYLYEDSAGTIPASVGGVVGLGLDIGKGLQISTEKVTNGDFNGATGWTISAGASVIDGQVVFDGTNATAYARQESVLEAYRTYKIELVISSITAGACCLLSGSAGAANGMGITTISAAGRYEFYIQPTVTGRLWISTKYGLFAGSVDSISCKEVLGNHALQATTANKPYLRRTPVSNKYWLDSNTSTGALTATFASSLGSACTIATVGAEGVNILENQTIGTTYNIAPPYGYNSDVLVINRALTPVEKALVARHFQRGLPTVVNGVIL